MKNGAGLRVRKFYATVEAEERDGAFAVLLDGRPARTPARAPLALPGRELCEAVADEWRGEGDFVDFDAMMLTRLASTAIDLAPAQRGQWREEVLSLLGSDLLAYRAEAPEKLIQRQTSTWTPFIDWAESAFGARLRTTTGLARIEQPEALLAAAGAHLSAMDDWALIGVKTAAAIAGSSVLGLALQTGAFPAKEIFDASRLDERFQAERWGSDPEAAAREARIEADFMAVANWLELLSVR